MILSVFSRGTGEALGPPGWGFRGGRGKGRGREAGGGGYDMKMGPNWWVRYRVKGGWGRGPGEQACDHPRMCCGGRITLASPTGRGYWPRWLDPDVSPLLPRGVFGAGAGTAAILVPVGEGGLAALEHSAPSLLPPAVRVGLGRALDLFLLAATWGGRSTPTLGGGYPIRGNGVPRGARRGVMGRSAG